MNDYNYLTEINNPFAKIGETIKNAVDSFFIVRPIIVKAMKSTIEKYPDIKSCLKIYSNFQIKTSGYGLCGICADITDKENLNRTKLNRWMREVNNIIDDGTKEKFPEVVFAIAYHEDAIWVKLSERKNKKK